MTMHQQPLSYEIEYGWKRRLGDHRHAKSTHNQGALAIRNRWRDSNKQSQLCEIVGSAGGKIQSKGFNFGANAQALQNFANLYAPKLMASALAIESCVTISHVLFATFSFKEKVEIQSVYWYAVKCCFIFVLPLVVLSNSSCSLPLSNDLIVTSLRCSPSAFDSFRTNTEIRYILAKPASVTLFIAKRDASGALVLVRMLAQDIFETKGSHGHTWLGDTEQGLFAESGLYIAVLQIESNQYETSVRVFHF